MVKLVAVEALPGYRIRAVYSDGVEGEVDLTHLVGKGIFAAWRDPNVFRSVSIGSAGEISWGGDIDLCPDAIYLKITGKKPEELFPALALKATHA